MFVLFLSTFFDISVTISVPGEPFMTSTNFTIDNTTGVISSIVDTPAIGTHTLRVVAYHTVDPENSVDEVEVGRQLWKY